MKKTDWRETLMIRAWALRFIPLLFFVRPAIVELTGERSVVRIPLRRRTSNHLGSMYFAALCAGADAAAGLAAFKTISSKRARVSLIFKDFSAEFFKRAEGDVEFSCSDGAAVREAVERTIGSGERENVLTRVVATVPSISEEPIASFVLTLSLKRRD
jgi:acyl-coenzyme A thioesterase PaaI-like protein